LILTAPAVPLPSFTANAFDDVIVEAVVMLSSMAELPIVEDDANFGINPVVPDPPIPPPPPPPSI
jgi:hypothetical protein